MAGVIPCRYKEAVNQPMDVEVNAEFTHPATTSYHTMKHLVTDPTRVNPIFFYYPVDLQRARTTLVPDWKRALERKRPLPMHPSLRSPTMIGWVGRYAMYAMHAHDRTTDRQMHVVCVQSCRFYACTTRGRTGTYIDILKYALCGVVLRPPTCGVSCSCIGWLVGWLVG